MKRHDFGPEAFVYVRERFAKGGPFAQALLNRALESGSLFTNVPDSVTVEQLLDFEGGDLVDPNPLTPAERGGYWQEVHIDSEANQRIEVITRHLGEGGDRCAIFEDAWAKPEDWPERSGVLITPDNGVAYFAVHDTPREVVQERSGVTAPWVYLCLLAHHGTISLQDGSIISRTDLEALVEQTNTFILGVYDGEGELYWSRQDAV